MLVISSELQNIVYEKKKEFSELAHILRHDLRNLVAAIEGYAYLLKDENNPDYLDRIVKNSKNITLLVDRALQFVDSELRLENETKINLEIVINACKEFIPESVNLKVSKLPTVLGDYSRIFLIFKQLLENAVEHGKPKNIEIKFVNSKSLEAVIQVINDGQVIPNEKVAIMFTKPQSFKKNSGIGLLIAKRLIEAHGWSFTYSSEITNKTCFLIHIPKEKIII